MTAPRIAVPVPRDLRSLLATGPISPLSADSAGDATLSVFDALGNAADAEASDQGWCCWWASPPRHAGHVVRLDVWMDDDSGGHRSLAAVREHLEVAGFLVQVSGRVSTPSAVQRGARPRHARLGAARVGRLFGDLPAAVELREELDGVQAEPRWRWPVQPCPSCGHEGHPVERIVGFPTHEAELAAALGEAMLVGCLVDAEGEAEAACGRCGDSFTPIT